MAERNIPEPAWCNPQYAEGTCSALKAKLTPYLITGAIVRLVQYHFSDPNNIETPQLKDYIWTDNPNGCISTVVPGIELNPDCTVSSTEEVIDGSKLLVGVSYQRNGQNVQQRPAIFIKREAVTNGEISMRGQSLDSKNQDTSFYPGTRYQVNIEGTHSLIAIGKTGAEAELLAEEVFFRMMHYKAMIRDDLSLGLFQSSGMSEVRELAEEAEKAFYVVTKLKWAYVYRWMVIPEAPLLKRMSLSFDYPE